MMAVIDWGLVVEAVDKKFAVEMVRTECTDIFWVSRMMMIDLISPNRALVNS